MVEKASTRLEQSHPQSPAAKWEAYQKAVKAAALRTGAEREARDREQRDSTEYHRRAEQTKGAE